MSKREMIERSIKALEEFDRLPSKEQIQILIDAGTINERGEVLMGLEEAKALEEKERAEAAK